MEIEGKMGDPRASWTQAEQSVGGTLEFVERFMSFNDPTGALPEFSQYIGEGRYVIISSNHSQHVNIAGLYGVVRRLDQKPALGWDLVIADSLVEGDQGKSLQEFALGMKPYLGQEKIELKPVLREKDIKEYYGENKKSAEELAKAKARSAETMRELAEVARYEEKGLLVFPSGTIEEARKRPDGRRGAMKKVGSTFVPSLIRRAIRERRDIAVLPVGMSRTYKIVNPDTKIPTPITLLSMGLAKVADHVGIDIPDIKRSDVNIGRVIQIRDFENAGIDPRDKDGDRKIIDLIMRASASLIPYKDRGYYDGRKLHA